MAKKLFDEDLSESTKILGSLKLGVQLGQGATRMKFTIFERMRRMSSSILREESLLTENGMNKRLLTF